MTNIITTFKRDTIENFEAQVKKATLPLMVLTVLKERDMYAYEITQEALRRSNGRYKMPILYHVINKLQEMNCIVESRKEISDENRVRIYYHITPEGEDYLDKIKVSYLELTEVVNNIVFYE